MEIKVIFGSARYPAINIKKEDLLHGIEAYDKAVELGYTGSINDLYYTYSNIFHTEYSIILDDIDYIRRSERFIKDEIFKVDIPKYSFNKFVKYKFNSINDTLYTYIDNKEILELWENDKFPSYWRL